jgi:hypothetical protein
VEHDVLVDAVQELGAEVLLHLDPHRVADQLAVLPAICMIWCEPRLLVITITVFLKSTVRPCPSVSGRRRAPAAAR